MGGRYKVSGSTATVLGLTRCSRRRGLQRLALGQHCTVGRGCLKDTKNPLPFFSCAAAHFCLYFALSSFRRGASEEKRFSRRVLHRVMAMKGFSC